MIVESYAEKRNSLEISGAILGSRRKPVEAKSDLTFDECSHARCVHSAIAELLR
jgi:hypothetical protein